MTDLIGTVHKPKQPPIPEPEGWTIYQRRRDSSVGTLSPWYTTTAELHTQGWAENRATELMGGGWEVRLIYVGPAPKPPVEAIRRLLNWCNDQDDFGYHLRLTESANSVHRWLSTQEEDDK